MHSRTFLDVTSLDWNNGSAFSGDHKNRLLRIVEPRGCRQVHVSIFSLSKSHLPSTDHVLVFTSLFASFYSWWTVVWIIYRWLSFLILQVLVWTRSGKCLQDSFLLRANELQSGICFPLDHLASPNNACVIQDFLTTHNSEGDILQRTTELSFSLVRYRTRRHYI